MKNLFKPVTFTVALWQQICATLVMLWAIIIVTTSTFSYYIFAPSIRIADTIPTAILRNVLNNRVTILENRMIQMESRKRDSLKKEADSIRKKKEENEIITNHSNLRGR